MPIYEYVCTKCGAAFEEITTSIASGANQVSCPSCASTEVTKAVSAPAMHTTAGSAASLPMGGSAGCGGSSGFS